MHTDNVLEEEDTAIFFMTVHVEGSEKLFYWRGIGNTADVCAEKPE